MGPAEHAFDGVAFGELVCSDGRPKIRRAVGVWNTLVASWHCFHVCATVCSRGRELKVPALAEELQRILVHHAADQRFFVPTLPHGQNKIGHGGGFRGSPVAGRIHQQSLRTVKLHHVHGSLRRALADGIQRHAGPIARPPARGESYVLPRDRPAPGSAPVAGNRRACRGSSACPGICLPNAAYGSESAGLTSPPARRAPKTRSLHCACFCSARFRRCPARPACRETPESWRSLRGPTAHFRLPWR